MKKIIFAVIFVSLLVGLMALIPNSPSTAYPPSTPLPPVSVAPIYFGVYCQYISPVNPGLIRVKWDDPPIWFNPDTENPGVIEVFYNNQRNEYLELQLEENGITKIWATIWHPRIYETAQIYGWVNNSYGGFEIIQPTYYYKYCPEPFIYLPFVRK